MQGKMNVRMGLVFLLCAALSGICVAELAETASLVPADTMFLMEVRDFDSLQAQWQKTTFYQLCNDPAMKPFVDAVWEKAKESMLEGDKGIMKEILDSKLLPSGRVALAVGMEPGADEPWPLVLSEWGDRVGKVKELMERAIRIEAEEGKLHRKSENFTGIEVQQVIWPDPNSDGDDNSMAYCFIDDCLLVGELPQQLRSTIAHIKGASGASLKMVSDYTATMAATGPWHDVDIFVNIDQIKKVFASDAETTAELEKYGVGNVKTFGYSLGLARFLKSSSGIRAFLKIDGEKNGFMKLLDLKKDVIKAPAFLPASTYSLAVMNVDFKTNLEQLSTMFPQVGAVLYMPLTAATEGSEPVVLKRDIIDNLTDKIIIATCMNEGDSEPEAMFAFAIQNRQQFEGSLAKLHGQMLGANPESKREFLGHTIYEFNPMMFMMGQGPSGMADGPMQPGPGMAQMPAAPSISFTVTDSHFIAGQTAAVEKALRTLADTGAQSLNEAAWFNKAKLDVPSVVGMASFEDSATSLKTAWENFRTQGLMGLMGSAAMITGGPELPIDPSLLPEFETVEKYFGTISCYGISKPDGFFIESRYNTD